MIFQEGPAETLNYMILGYAVILGAMALFVISLIVRFRNLRKDVELLDELEKRPQR
ncbi:MAG TPA: hypothetical protein VFI11_11695 [Anaerolineales bacterium]|nr:hypothetical protein [Anaerolineales bacterium]